MKQFLRNSLMGLALVTSSLSPLSSFNHHARNLNAYERLRPDLEFTQPSQIRRPTKTGETFVDIRGFYQGFRYEYQTRANALQAYVPIDRAFSTLSADDPLNLALPITSQLQIALFHWPNADWLPQDGGACGGNTPCCPAVIDVSVNGKRVNVDQDANNTITLGPLTSSGAYTLSAHSILAGPVVITLTASSN
jgi:hypothetical protein